MATNFYTTDSTLGAQLNIATTGQLFPLGERATGNNGSTWIYGKAASVVLAYDFVCIDTNFNINSITAALVKSGQQIASCQTTGGMAAAAYGWVCISGSGLLMNVVASTQTSVPVIPSATTGSVDTTAGVAAGVTTILGIQLTTTAGLTATAISGTLTNPVLKL
jgi:hypothetical protein